MFSWFRNKADDERERRPEPEGAASPESPQAEGTSTFDFEALRTPPAPPPEAAQAGPQGAARTAELEPRIIEALRTVYDPEIPVNIYDLGLIYDIAADAAGHVHIRMTLTSPACPSAQQLPVEVQWKAKAVPGVTDASVEIVWDPPWTKEMMAEDARLALGIF